MIILRRVWERKRRKCHLRLKKHPCKFLQKDTGDKMHLHFTHCSIQSHFKIRIFEHGFSHVINSLYYIGILKLCQSNTYMKDYPRVASHNLRTHQVNFFFQVLCIPIFSTLLAPLLFVVCGCRQFVIIFHFLL